MANGNYESWIIGTWYDDTTETEWGPARKVITFEEKNYFRAEIFFGEAENPLVVEGRYEVSGRHLSSEELNKGRPIPIEFRAGGNELILYLPGEEPTKMLRKR